MTPDYRTNDPKGWGGDPKRGAALGRPSIHKADREAPIKLYLRKVRLDSGGYDPNGTYFGIGAPLYWVSDSEGTVDYMLRAIRRSDAKAMVRQVYPKASFFGGGS